MRRTGQRATRLLTRFRRNGEIHRLPDRAVVRALRDLTEDHHGCTRSHAAPGQALRGRVAARARRRYRTVATFEGSSSNRVRASGASSRTSSRRGGVWVAWRTPQLDSLFDARRSDGALARRSPSASPLRVSGHPPRGQRPGSAKHGAEPAWTAARPHCAALDRREQGREHRREHRREVRREAPARTRPGQDRCERETSRVPAFPDHDDYGGWVRLLADPIRSQRAFWHLVLSGPDGLDSVQAGA